MGSAKNSEKDFVGAQPDHTALDRLFSNPVTISDDSNFSLKTNMSEEQLGAAGDSDGLIVLDRFFNNSALHTLDQNTILSIVQLLVTKTPREALERQRPNSKCTILSSLCRNFYTLNALGTNLSAVIQLLLDKMSEESVGKIDSFGSTPHRNFLFSSSNLPSKITKSL